MKILARTATFHAEGLRRHRIILEDQSTPGREQYRVTTEYMDRLKGFGQGYYYSDIERAMARFTQEFTARVPGFTVWRYLEADDEKGETNE